jgi:hypothetical protein
MMIILYYGMWGFVLFSVIMVMLLKMTSVFQYADMWKQCTKQSTLHSSVVCYVHVLLHSVAKQMFTY